MTDLTLRRIVATAIALLLVHQISVLIAGLYGMAWGGVSALVAAAVSFFSARLARAGGKSTVWFLLPTLLFTLIPLALKVMDTFNANTSVLDRLLSLLPFVVGFAAPIALLLIAYWALRRRTISTSPIPGVANY